MFGGEVFDECGIVDGVYVVIDVFYFEDVEGVDYVLCWVFFVGVGYQVQVQFFVVCEYVCEFFWWIVMFG